MQIATFTPKRESRNSVQALIRPYTRKDYRSVCRLLDDLPARYPNGDAWLDRRLGDVLCGRARCTVAESQSQVIGITIETPKSRRRLKLSTIFVRPDYRGFRIGTNLIQTCHSRWICEELEQVYVTADERIRSLIIPPLQRVGFELVSIIPDRYGAGQNEMVLCWGHRLPGRDHCGAPPSRSSYPRSDAKRRPRWGWATGALRISAQPGFQVRRLPSQLGLTTTISR
jgi:N-acetylglutamate synthase-like GNAT family acetyltransferase